MPIYEQDPKELLGEGIQQIAAPDDSNFYMETPSLLSAVNPFTSDQRVQRSRQAAFRIDNTLGSFIASAPFSQFDRVEGYNPFDNDAADIKGYEDFADSFINPVRMKKQWQLNIESISRELTWNTIQAWDLLVQSLL